MQLNIEQDISFNNATKMLKHEIDFGVTNTLVYLARLKHKAIIYCLVDLNMSVIMSGD